jgi:hypothetical protein
MKNLIQGLCTLLCFGVGGLHAATAEFKFDFLKCNMLTTDNQPAMKFELHPEDPFGNDWVLHETKPLQFKERNFEVSTTVVLEEERATKISLGLTEVGSDKDGKPLHLWKAETEYVSTYPAHPDASLALRGYPAPVDYTAPYIYFEVSCYVQHKVPQK